MRFKSKKQNGFTVYAVTGTNTVSFAIDFDKAAAKGLLGFSVERIDSKKDEQYFLKGFKVFKSVVPKPDETTRVTTFDHPVQSFVWDDFTCEPGSVYTYKFYPVKGKAKKLERLEPAEIKFQMEPLYDTNNKHQVFFNRGVASSQEYSRRFGLERIKGLSPEEKAERFKWLGRDLPGAMLKFIAQAKKGDTLYCCFYEFSSDTVLTALKKAQSSGVILYMILDAKIKAATADKTSEQNSANTYTTYANIDKYKFNKKFIVFRTINPAAIQHNKFMVYCKKGSKGDPSPQAVFTGSVNITDSGIYGQTNVGHWVNDAAVAQTYVDYWHLMKAHGENEDDKQYKKEVEALQPTLTGEEVMALESETTPLFSPRTGTKMLKSYVSLIDSAVNFGCITLAFGISKDFKTEFIDNSAESALLFLLLEKEDKATAKNGDTYVDLDGRNNIYEAFGSYIDNPVYEFAKETNAALLGVSHFVKYIHSKFMLVDPFGDNPLLISGSANFSANSTSVNDENMLIVRNNTRVIDIYFTEFNRLFNHYYFRTVHTVLKRDKNYKPLQDSRLFLYESDAWVKEGYGSKNALRMKRINILKQMKGAVILE